VAAEMKCPHRTRSKTNRYWWPHQLNVQLLGQHSPQSNPMAAAFAYAEEFYRYNRDRIDIDTAELGHQEVTGVFEDPVSFVAFLSSIPGAGIREGANGARIIASKSDGHPDTRRVP
jgi:hypothetical protein